MYVDTANWTWRMKCPKYLVEPCNGGCGNDAFGSTSKVCNAYKTKFYVWTFIPTKIKFNQTNITVGQKMSNV